MEGIEIDVGDLCGTIDLGNNYIDIGDDNGLIDGLRTTKLGQDVMLFK